MDLKALGDYNQWIGESPAEVLRSVKMVGGWERVFPIGKPMPLWAHKIRNYFNEIPSSLELWAADRAREWSKPLLSRSEGVLEEYFTLSGDVYNDETGRVWLQMSPGAAIYHFGFSPPPWFEAIDASYHQLRRQDYIPVIKLVSLDGTGGSSECIVHSLRVPPDPVTIIREAPWPVVFRHQFFYESVIGDVGVRQVVHTRVVTDREFQASYNYSETMDKGLGAHRMRDIEPHHRDPMGYVDPPLYPHPSTLHWRRFPRFDNQGRELALQV